MALSNALLSLILLQAPLGPTPAPNRYDDAYDARLFEAWGGFENGVGSRDPQLAQQPPPLRPKDWRLLEVDEADPEARAVFLGEQVVSRSGKMPIEERGRLASMPPQGPIQGSFGYAFARLEADQGEVRFLRAPGVEMVFINGEGFIGDPDHRGWLGVPVALCRGTNEILAVGIRGGFELELWKPVTRIVMASWALQVTGTDPWPNEWDYLYVPLFNASTQEAEGIHFHYDRACPLGAFPGLSEWHDGVCALPLAIGHGLSYVFNPGAGVPKGPTLLAPAVAYLKGDAHGDRRLLQLRSDAPRPRWPAPVLMCWPPAPSLTTLVIEPSGDEAFDADALAVARFCQQRLWERSGELVPLFSATYYDAHGNWSDPRGGFTGLGQTHSVRFGRIGSVGSVLHVGSKEGTEPLSYEIRASDAAAMRLVYAVEPFFRPIGPEGETWTLP